MTPLHLRLERLAPQEGGAAVEGACGPRAASVLNQHSLPVCFCGPHPGFLAFFCLLENALCPTEELAVSSTLGYCAASNRLAQAPSAICLSVYTGL